MLNKLILQLKRFGILLNILGILQTASFLIQLAKGNPVIRIRVKGIATPVYCRAGHSDIFVLFQIFWRKEFDMAYPKDLRVMIDGGANVGYTSLYFANRFPGVTIIPVEPDDANFTLLQRNCKAYDNIIPIHGALWSEHKPLYIQNPDAPSWELRMGEAAAPVATIDAPIMGYTVREVMDSAGVDYVDVLKLDIEGGEKELFSANVDQWIDDVDLIMVELHDRYVAGCTQTVMAVAERHARSVAQHGEYTLLQR